MKAREELKEWALKWGFSVCEVPPTDETDECLILENCFGNYYVFFEPEGDIMFMTQPEMEAVDNSPIRSAIEKAFFDYNLQYESLTNED